MLIHVLAVGDVVGEGGQDILSRRLPELRKETGAHFTVVNGENASGVGITPAQARRMLEAGADVITLGNHTWNRIQIGAFLDKEDRILRPANYAGRVPGRGFGIYQCQGLRLAVLNIMGRVDLNSNLDSPFKAANFHWSRGGFDLMLGDFHAEATSEKGAMGWHLDGRAAAVWGTHTHVPTADGRGRVAAFEVLHANMAIRNLIREGKTHQIPSIMQTSRKLGMVTMDESIIRLVQEGMITRQEAVSFAVDPGAMENRL